MINPETKQEPSLRTQKWNDHFAASTETNSIKTFDDLLLYLNSYKYLKYFLIFIFTLIILYILSPPIVGKTSEDPLDINTPILWKVVFWSILSTIAFLFLDKYN